jgi:hypothetical protein
MKSAGSRVTLYDSDVPHPARSSCRQPILPSFILVESRTGAVAVL